MRNSHLAVQVLSALLLILVTGVPTTLLAGEFERDISEVYGIDPSLNVDNEDDGFEINCGGKHPRFNSITLDGVSQNDRFGLNSNGYSTAVGMPFPYDAIEQVLVDTTPGSAI